MAGDRINRMAAVAGFSNKKLKCMGVSPGQNRCMIVITTIEEIRPCYTYVM